jgi:hypothetical protein
MDQPKAEVSGTEILREQLGQALLLRKILGCFDVEDKAIK